MKIWLGSPRRAGEARRIAGRLAADARGAIAIWFALAVLFLLILVVGVIDLSRIQSARTRLQDSLDAATLAVVRLGPLDDASVDREGARYLAAEFRHRSASLGTHKFKNGDDNDVVASAEATLDPLVADLVFRDGVKVQVTSIVKRAQQSPVELVLVLDTTASMAGARLTALKTAATSLVTEMTPVGVTTVKLAVAPFGQYVNVGVTRRNEPWMNVPADYVETIPAGKCTTQTTTTTCQTETYACTKYNDGVPYSTTCSRSINCVTKPLDPPKTTCPPATTKTYKFNGCAGSPPYPKNVRDDDPLRRYPGIMNATCGSEITPLTADAARVKAAVANLKASGDTYIPAGLAWGFNLLSSPVPMTEGLPYDASGKNLKPRKALVLMTDGMNTMKMNADGTHSSVTGGTVATQANTLTSELCVNIKAKNIELFTVAFEVTDTLTKSILKGCATDAEHYFDAKDTTALNAAFKNIAEAMRSIYIAK